MDSPREVCIRGTWYVEDPESGARYPVLRGGTFGAVEVPLAVTIAGYVAAAAAVAGTAVSAIGAYQQGQVAKQTARYNADLAAQQAEAERTAGAFAERQQREHDRRMIGRARALYGAAGVDPGTGSPLLVELDSVRQAEYNAQAVRYGAQAKAHFLESQAALDRFKGDAYGRAGTMGAGYSLLQGLGQAAGSIYSMGTRRTPTPNPYYYNPNG